MSDLRRTLKEDFERHQRSLRHLGLWVVGVYHFGVWANQRQSRLARWLSSKAYGVSSLLVELGTGCSLDRRTQVGEGLHVVHSGNIRIHPDAVIGQRCGIMNDVTIGTAMDRPGAPRIGDDVFIGSGARILGPITIGDRATIAANTLVITDIPAGAHVIGVPGRPLPVRAPSPLRQLPVAPQTDERQPKPDTP
jgi:serine O-acetyltransferase